MFNLRNQTDSWVFWSWMTLLVPPNPRNSDILDNMGKFCKTSLEILIAVLFSLRDLWPSLYSTCYCLRWWNKFILLPPFAVTVFWHSLALSSCQSASNTLQSPTIHAHFSLQLNICVFALHISPNWNRCKFESTCACAFALTSYAVSPCEEFALC